MILLKPTLLALCVLAAGPDPVELVTKLGAARYAEREAAANALEKLGGEALPALNTAREAKDPEVRTRVAALIERIENQMMVQPTLVRLDFANRPLSEIVHALSERAHMSLNLVPDNGPQFAGRRLNLQAAEPVPFWEAIDDLCRLGRLQFTPGAQPMMGMGRGRSVRLPSLNLSPLPPTLGPAPSDSRGPFRLSVVNLHYQRDRNFSPLGNPAIFMGGMVPQGIPAPAAAPPGGPDDAAQGVASEQFLMMLQLVAEPRMSVVLTSPLRVLEAVDDLGQSLVPPDEALPVGHDSGYRGFSPMGSAIVQVSTPLKPPERPSQWLKRLRCVAPVAVSSRKEHPMIIPLANAKGKTFRNSDLSIQIHNVSTEPPPPGNSLIELTVQNLATSDEPNQPPFPQLEMRAFQPQPGPNSQIEIVDDQGRLYHQWFNFNFSPQPGNQGVRMTLRLIPTDGVGAPAQIRYYDLARASTEATFELHDIKMP